MGEQLSELPGPHPDRLIAQVNSPLGHEVLDIPEAQGEPEIQPDHEVNDNPQGTDGGQMRQVSLSGITFNGQVHHSALTAHPST